ncbi:MAG: hypothetical protein KAQ94_09430 [Arcobacteraceae bacterium]|nr:hypothetical protein [Arcobacteraceae bacterium]
MNDKELQEARTNPEFLNYLETREKEAIASENLEILYEVLDNLLILDLEEVRINKIYETILRVAFDDIEDRLNGGNKLSLLNDDIYLIRAFYEHAIEKWSNENFQGAKELFFILSRIIEDKKLSSAIKIHLIACAKSIDMDKFQDTLVSQDQMADDEVYGYFIVNFRVDTKEYISENREILGDLLDELGHMLD